MAEDPYAFDPYAVDRPLTPANTNLEQDLSLLVRFGDCVVRPGSGEPLLLGRALESPMSAALAPCDNVSRSHCRIVAEHSSFVVEDLASANGTFLDDERLVAHIPHPLTPGSQLRLGSNIVIDLIWE